MRVLVQRSSAGDLALAAGFAAIAVLELTQPVEELHQRAPLGLDLVLQGLFCGTLLLRSRRQVAGFLAMNAVFVLPALVTARAGFLFANAVPLLIMTFTVARHDHGRWSRWAWLSGVAFWLGLVLHSGRHAVEVGNPLLPVGMTVATWAIARVLHRYDVQRAQLEAARDRLADEQGNRERLAVAEERARIAADMHDVVAHAVSLMVVQVGAARMSMEKSRPQQPNLRAAEGTGRQALVELRQSLGLLRPEGEPRARRLPEQGVPSSSLPVPRPAGRFLDLGMAVLFAAVAVVESVDTSFDDGSRAGRVWVNVVIGALLCLPLAWRRQAPTAVYLTMLAVALLPSLVVAHSLYLFGTLLPLCIAAYTVARQSDGLVARYAWLPAMAPPAVLHDSSVEAAVSDVAFLLLLLLSAWGAGRALRRFDVQGAELRNTLQDLAVEQAASELAAVGQERRRIAAEMHDVVAHAVSTMVVQIGAARMDTADEADQQRLRAAEDTGRQALAELRDTLGLLTGEDPLLAPLPGQELLPALFDGFRSAGLDVRAEVDLKELPAGLGLTVYRVVQEALTNALKHGPLGVVEVSVAAADELVITVVNELGPGTRLPPGGHGLAGMRERLGIYGGTLAAAPTDGRFEVRAVLPLVPMGAMA
ncbi:MAG: hypothetical protein JWO12_2727 [Frankiales bacterium]|nr:hypothetical protein [Frankiales bacterium]